MSSTKIERNNRTWLSYGFLCCYAFFLNLPGPINGFLKGEFKLDYAMLSLHASAFALGMVISGVFGHHLIKRLTHWQGLALGTIGLGVGGMMVAFGQSPFLTISGLFLNGLVGTLILSIYPNILREEMGENQSVGITEANVFAAVFSTLAPLVVGFSAAWFKSWRPLVVVASILVSLIGLTALFLKRGNRNLTSPDLSTVKAHEKLTLKYWFFWVGLFLGVSVEFCTIYFASLYSESILNLNPTQAAQAVSLFLAGGIVGRTIVSKLVKPSNRLWIVVISLLLAATGFGLLWWAPSIWVALTGLALMGFGVSNFYPMILSLALDASAGNEKLASSRATLASGIAILCLPLLLGLLADQLGIWLGFGLVGVLLVLLSGVLRVATRINDQVPFRRSTLKRWYL